MANLRSPNPVSAAPGPNAILLAVCGWVGVGGVVAVIVSNAIGSAMVPNYDWVAHTISNLAAGRYEIIQDVGLYAFAASLMACSLGAAHIHPGTNRWTAGVLCLATMAALVVVIGARNEYGDDDPVATWDIHLSMVYALMTLFLATTLLMARGFDRMGSRYRTVSVVCAALFVPSVLAYFLAPTGYDGLVERVVVLVPAAWVVAVSWMLFKLRGTAGRQGQGSARSARVAPPQ